MDSLKLLLISFEFPPYPLAGTGQYALNLIKSLKNHEVTLLTAAHGESESDNECTVKKVDIGFKASKVNRSFIDKKTLFAFKLRKFMRNLNLRDYDLLHSITLRDSAFLDYDYLHKFFPVIVSVNDYYIIGASWNPLKFHFKSSDFLFRYMHHNILKQFYARSLKGCDRIIANAEFTKKAIVDIGVPANKINVVHRGIDVKKFETGVSDEKYSNHSILFVGPNMERKGAMSLIKAAPGIIEKFPDATFTLIGSASWLYMKKIKDFLRKLDISGKFTFIPQLAQKDLVNYYANANVFVMPSVLEALGQVYMEAMMARTPVIGANVGGVSEVVSPETGFLVKPGHPKEITACVAKIFFDKELAKRMGQAGRERIKGYFTTERMVSETLNIYKSVLGR